MMEASRNSLNQGKILPQPAESLKTKARNKYITDFFEKRSFPLVSRAKERVRQIKDIVSLAIGQKRCRKFVFSQATL